MAGSLGCRTVRIPEDHDMLAPFVLGHPRRNLQRVKERTPPHILKWIKKTSQTPPHAKTASQVFFLAKICPIICHVFFQ